MNAKVICWTSILCGTWFLLLALADVPMLTPGLAGVLIICASAVDVVSLRLPHVLTLPAAMIAIIGSGTVGAGWDEAIAGAIGGFVILKAAQWLCRWRTGRECLGSGDCILMLSLGALTGPALLPFAIGIASLTGLAALLAVKQNRLPFGPFLTLGGLSTAFAEAVVQKL